MPSTTIYKRDQASAGASRWCVQSVAGYDTTSGPAQGISRFGTGKMWDSVMRRIDGWRKIAAVLSQHNLEAA